MSSDHKITNIESSEVKKIFSTQCLEFVTDLHNLFNSKRIHLLEERKKIQQKIDSGWMPDFLEETQSIRESDWTIFSTPDDLLDRRVEITAPPARKMIINALNSGAKTFMADFEDSLSPTWKNIIDGHVYLKEAVNRNIE